MQELKLGIQNWKCINWKCVNWKSFCILMSKMLALFSFDALVKFSWKCFSLRKHLFFFMGSLWNEFQMFWNRIDVTWRHYGPNVSIKYCYDLLLVEFYEMLFHRNSFEHVRSFMQEIYSLLKLFLKVNIIITVGAAQRGSLWDIDKPITLIKW